MRAMDTTPLWLDPVRHPPFPRLQRDLDVDVAVIGGGLIDRKSVV